MKNFGLVVGFLAFAQGASAQIAVPYTFTANSQISSSQMNDNFTSVTAVLNSFATNVSTQGVALQNGANSVFLRAPLSLPSAYTLRLPQDAGATGQVLTSDGTGNLSWSSAGGNPSAGLTMTGPLILASNPSGLLQAAPKQYVDGMLANSMTITGNNVSAPVNMGTQNAFPLQIMTNSIQRMIITENGKFGFGTMTPSAIYTFQSALQGGNFFGTRFQSDVDLSTASGGYRASEIIINESNSGPATPPQKMFLMMSKNGTNRYIFDDEGTKFYDSSAMYYLKTRVSGAGVEFTSTSPYSFSGGSMGIGTITPSESLHVIGNILTSGTVTQASDRRLKKDIRPIENALDKIGMIEGVSYEWKENQKHHQGRELGVIAQDVEKVFPEAVRTDKSGLKAVSYSALVSPLINAVKELKAENDMLKSYLCRQDPSAPFCKAN